jgi:exodeoxyribonuclease VII large subunit
MEINSLRERVSGAPVSVSELNAYIKGMFENNRALASVTVKGEISNFTNHRSGHFYFTLKDADGQIKAVMFRSRSQALKFMPESGMKVIVHGSVSVFERDGAYQLYVNSMQPDGIGALYFAYEQLKEKLYKNGVFDPAHKLSLPEYPKNIGIITSPTGAAVRDIINVIGRRYPLARLYLYPSLVQGEGAEENLIRAVDYFDRSGLCDVVIIGRGGGSIEDLWAFNSEHLAMRIYESRVPIVSAVGHETDFTICDFVSDMRAPTPSAAAELVVPDINELFMRLDSLDDRIRASLHRKVDSAAERLASLSERVRRDTLTRFIDLKRLNVSINYEKARNSVISMIEDFKKTLSLNAEKANALSPLFVISRGYSLAENESGVVSSVEQVSVGDAISVRVSDGIIDASVKKIKEV